MFLRLSKTLHWRLFASDLARKRGGALRLAHKTGGGSTRKNKDSVSKRLGVKIYGGGKVLAGNIIVRQKGNKFYPGIGTKQGNDFTIFAITSGQIEFKKKLNKTYVSVS